jgi:hypothetical protein
LFGGGTVLVAFQLAATHPSRIDWELFVVSLAFGIAVGITAEWRAASSFRGARTRSPTSAVYVVPAICLTVLLVKAPVFVRAIVVAAGSGFLLSSGLYRYFSNVKMSRSIQHPDATAAARGSSDHIGPQ